MFSNLLINMLFVGWFLRKNQQWFLYRRCIIKIHNTTRFNRGLQSNTNPIEFLQRIKTTLVEANFASVGQPPSSGSGPHLNYHGIIRFVRAVSSSETFLARPCISLNVFTYKGFPPLNLIQVDKSSHYVHILTTSQHSGCQNNKYYMNDFLSIIATFEINIDKFAVLIVN